MVLVVLAGPRHEDPEAVEAAEATDGVHALGLDGRVVVERGGDGGVDQHVAGAGHVHQAVGEVDRSTEDVALAQHDRTGGDAGPERGQAVVVTDLGDQAQRGLGRHHRIGRGEHDLVADHLHHPPGLLGHDVGRSLGEDLDELGQLPFLRPGWPSW